MMNYGVPRGTGGGALSRMPSDAAMQPPNNLIGYMPPNGLAPMMGPQQFAPGSPPQYAPSGERQLPQMHPQFGMQPGLQGDPYLFRSPSYSELPGARSNPMPQFQPGQDIDPGFSMSPSQVGSMMGQFGFGGNGSNVANVAGGMAGAYAGAAGGPRPMAPQAPARAPGAPGPGLFRGPDGRLQRRNYR